MKDYSYEKIIQYKRLIRKLRKVKGGQKNGKIFVREANSNK